MLRKSKLSAKKLGYIQTNEPTGNCCWGDDGSTIYITSNMFLIRVKTQTMGTWFPVVAKK